MIGQVLRSEAEIYCRRFSEEWIISHGNLYPIKVDIIMGHHNRFLPAFILQGDGSRVSSVCQDGVLVTSPFNECHTLVDCFLRGHRVASQSDSRCFGWRPAPDQPFSWLTYQDVYQRAKNFGSGTNSFLCCACFCRLSHKSALNGQILQFAVH